MAAQVHSSRVPFYTPPLSRYTVVLIAVTSEVEQLFVSVPSPILHYRWIVSSLLQWRLGLMLHYSDWSASRAEALLIPMGIATSPALGTVIDPNTALDDRIWKPDFQPATMERAWRWGCGLTLGSVTSMMVLGLDSASSHRQSSLKRWSSFSLSLFLMHGSKEILLAKSSMIQ